MSWNKVIRFWRNRINELGATVYHVDTHGHGLTFHLCYLGKATQFWSSKKLPTPRVKQQGLTRLRRTLQQIVAREHPPAANDNLKRRRKA